MAEYNPSKIIKDGNTYNFRDTTKIPLTGSNQISGDLIPATDNSIDVGSSTNNIKMLYTKGITIDGAQFLPSDYIPMSGTYSITGTDFFKATNTSSIVISGGRAWNTGAYLGLTGGAMSEDPGTFILHACTANGSFCRLIGKPNGTLTWNGQSIQTTSDQRLKQQISEIDDKLLDAWGDVEPVQFKYNDAVKEKSDNARLHTGYIVQQIDEACKSHGVDISEYGLYCHEVYQEETREVEHDDGTKTTEVVRPANEHYSLRYTEALIVECAYLRKCIKELRNEIEELKSSK